MLPIALFVAREVADIEPGPRRRRGRRRNRAETTPSGRPVRSTTVPSRSRLEVAQSANRA
jgi:hypothetical protein